MFWGSLLQHAFLVGCLQTAMNYLSKSDEY